jgi:hypothetical protein
MQVKFVEGNFTGPAASSTFLFRASMGFTSDGLTICVSVCPPGLPIGERFSLKARFTVVILNGGHPHPILAHKRKVSAASPEKICHRNCFGFHRESGLRLDDSTEGRVLKRDVKIASGHGFFVGVSLYTKKSERFFRVPFSSPGKSAFA